MPSVPCFSLRFTPSWVMCILTLIVVSLFLRLGFWQLQRAAQKSEMVSAELAMATKEAREWQPQDKMPSQYQRVLIKGHYLADIFLLDNQHQQHQFGYDVLSPLVLDNGKIVLVDRGWIAGDRTRRHYPPINTPQTRLVIQGSAYFPSNKQWVLGPSFEEKSAKLTILENLDTKIVSQILQKPAYPFIIRLDKKEDHGFVRKWAIVSMPPQRHLAYAWQWFAMALTVFIIFIALNLKKNEKIN
ncbi:SURF1 family protein [Legionella sp. km772]|uniref:SURF1 family protein n=1 Tax=Legionella sp. km772 TaxID=2498111 RepID=UPI000F8DE592|nr:SURF1 family protein [Legionella sp. km772]RUR08363.1 SURF1 family protein [Legionella sp. km772]